MSLTKEQIVGILSTGVHTVTYTKDDGSERVAQATLDESLIPGEKSVASRTEGDNVVTYWDVGSNGFRRFHPGSVSEIA